MGWTFFESFETIAQIKEEIKSDIDDLIDCGGSGNEFYCLVRSPKSGRTFIIAFILSKHNGCWGYKEMEESAGPYYYKCPTRLIKAADSPINEASRAWREEVIAEAERVKKRKQKLNKIKVGDTVRLTNCNLDSVVIVSLNPLCGETNGQTYKINKRHIKV